MLSKLTCPAVLNTPSYLAEQRLFSCVAIMYVDLFQPYLADGNVCVEPVIKMKGSLPSTSDSAGNAAYRELPRREFIYAASHTLVRSVPAYMLTWMK